VVNTSEKPDFPESYGGRGKNPKCIKTIKSIKSMQTQWACGFPACQYWEIALLVISVFMVFRVFTPSIDCFDVYRGSEIKGS
jgi:hypothetical protein